MASREKSIEWLVQQMEDYHSLENSMSTVVEDLDGIGKLGHVFYSVDTLEEIDIGDSSVKRPTYVNIGLSKEKKESMRALLKDFIDCFAWDYMEMPGLDRVWNTVCP
jgi:hypothetical protein